MPQKRNQAAARFRQLWIVLEKKYLDAYRIREGCELASP